MSHTPRLKNLIGFFALMVALQGAAFLLLYLLVLQPRWVSQAASDWAETPCEILSLKLLGNSPAKLKIHYRYDYQGVTYESTRYDLLLGESGEDAWAREAYIKLSMSDHTTCYVNPQQPSMAIIDRDRRHPRIALLLPAIFCAIGLVFGILFVSEALAFVLAQSGAIAPPSDGSRSDQTKGSVVLRVIGWVSGIGVSLLFFFALDGLEHARTLFYGRVQWVATDGIVDWKRPSGTRVLGAMITEYQVRYSVAGTEYSNRCYSTGSLDQPTIEVDRQRPWRGRLQGTKFTSVPAGFLVIPLGILALLGMAASVTIWRGLRWVASTATLFVTRSPRF